MLRRDFVIVLTRTMAFCGIGLAAFVLGRRSVKANVTQIDPERCRACGLCQSKCVRKISAVKCVNDFSSCGYCKYCFGYFPADPARDPNGRVCRYGALQRKRVSEFMYEYTVDEDKCCGCGECVKRCVAHGGKSLRQEIRGSFCLDCNSCSISMHCPYDAITRVPLET